MKSGYLGLLILLVWTVSVGCSTQATHDPKNDVGQDAAEPSGGSDAGDAQTVDSPDRELVGIPDVDTSDGGLDGEQTDAQPADTVPPFACREPIPERVLVNNPDETFDLGPYLMVPTPTSIVIRWRTLEERDGAVLYGLDDGTELEVKEEGTATVHSVTLTGLQPGTRYAYRVRSGNVTSDLHHFYTAPPAGGSFRFTAWGDNQGGAGFPSVVAAVLQDTPHIMLGLGDHVHDGRIDALWKDHLFGPARALFHEVAWFAAYGNHGKNGKLYYDLMAYENLQTAPGAESVYSYTYGNTFFLVVDTNGLFFSIGDVDTDWSQWIKEQVSSPAAQQATWRIAYAHEPGVPDEVSVASPCGGVFNTVNTGVKVWLLPLLQQHNFHAYFSGHVHIYERTMVGNLLHIISGGGGGGLEKCGIQSDVSVLAERHHYLRGLASCDSLRIEAVDTTGEVFDWVELQAGPPGVVVDQGAFPATY